MVETISHSVWQAIKESVTSGNLEDIKKIYEKEKLDYNAKDGYSEDTILHLATIAEQSNILKHFIEQGADIDSGNYLGYTPLLTAAREDRRKVAKLLLQNGANVNAKNNDGDTPLLITASRNSFKLAELLLDHNANVQTVNNNGKNALLIAAEKNSVRLPRLLITRGAETGRTGEGNSPLIIAAINNNVEVAQLLLQHKADMVDDKDCDGNTPLSLAVSLKNSVNLAQLLLDYKAGVDAKNNNEDTPLWIAAAKNHVEVAQLLLQHRANAASPLFRAARENNVRVVQVLTKLNVYLDTKNDDGDTALWIAAKENHEQIARLLSDHEADVATLLFRAVDEDNLNVIQLFIELGANLDVTKTDDRDTPLWIAAKENHLVIARLLFDNKAETTTLLFRAIHENNVEVAKILITLGIDVNIANNEGDTPLWLAAEKDHNDNMLAHLLFDNEANVVTLLFRAARENNGRVLKLLIELGADIDSKEGDGLDTPLWVAAQMNNEEVVELLFDLKADIASALLRAACEDNVKVIQLFLKLGAEVDTKISDDGDSPLWKAAENSHTEGAQILIENGADVHGLLFRAIGVKNTEIAQFLIEQGADVDSQDDKGDTVFKNAIKNKLVEVALLVLKKGADISVRDKDGKTALHYIKEDQSNRDINNIFRECPTVWNLSDPAAIIEDIDVREEYDDKTRCVLNDILSKAIDKLPNTIDDPTQRFVFYRGNMYRNLITVFLDRGGDDKDLLRTIYIALQAKLKCDQPKKEALQNELNITLYERFLERMKYLAFSSISEESLQKFIPLRLIARQIYFEYLKVAPKKEKKSRKGRKGKPKTERKKGVSCFQSVPPEVYHNCHARNIFAVFFCVLGISTYLYDLYTDFDVGVGGYKGVAGFSKKLGRFEIFLAVFTLLHENYWSSKSAYITDKELLQKKFGRHELGAEHWKTSGLNWSENRRIFCLYRIFWPYKISGRTGKFSTLKAILYNILTFLCLRPIVDRLWVLLHPPTTFREIYRRSTEQNSLRQYYIVLEQMPQLMILFYNFQVVVNNIAVTQFQHSEIHQIFDNSSCYHYFNYSRLSPNVTSRFCNYLPLSDTRLRQCGIVFWIFIMSMPWVKISSGIARLEKCYRVLDPLTPKLSLAQEIVLQISYTCMTPARLFMFAAFMHAVYIKEYVFVYFIIRTLLGLFINWRSLKFEERLGGKFSIMWRLCLFSFRDVFLLSMRDPVAYLSNPSEVSYDSLRDWKNLAFRAIPFVCEGLIGALFIEYRYPCGKYSHYFKYTGWFCLILLLFSLSILVMVSDLLHPIKTCSSSVRDKLKKSLFIWLISIIISGIAAVAFFLSQPRSIGERETMGVVVPVNILLNAVLIAGLIFFIRKSSSVRIIPKDPEKVNADTLECGDQNDDPDIAILKEVSTSSSQKIKKKISSVENDEPSYVEFIDECTTPLLHKPGPNVEHKGLTDMEEISSVENELPGNPDLEESDPLFDKLSSSTDTTSLKFDKGTSSGENNAPDVPLLDESSSSVRNMIALDVLKETISKKNVNASTVSDSMC